MSIDRRRLIVSIGALAVGYFATLPRARATTALDLAQLMQTLAAVRSGEAKFVERRDVAMLNRTLVSSGWLSFAAPDTFVRETLEPRRERMTITGNVLTVSEGGRTRTMEVDASPDAAVVIEAIRGTLTGNREALEHYFAASVSGTTEHWSLVLVPREAQLRDQVTSIRVSGEQASIYEVAVLRPDGDRSVMTIEAASTTTPALDAAKPSPALDAAKPSPALDAAKPSPRWPGTAR